MIGYMSNESRESPESKMRSPDRIFKMELMPGKKPKDVTGMTDPRLFSGDNRLHAIMDLQTSLWSFKYDHGNIPKPLSGRFTGVKQALDAARNYFEKRNIAITQVID